MRADKNFPGGTNNWSERCAVSRSIKLNIPEKKLNIPENIMNTQIVE